MTILVTGAGGKTGQAITRALSARGQTVRAFVRRQEQVAASRSLGALEFCSGDMNDEAVLERVLEGVQSVYLICPNVHPHELEIARRVVQQARRAGVERLVYHSVLHPQIEKMPHHWQKMRVEEYLFESGIAFTILQPSAYMQNLLAHRKVMIEQGAFPLPYATSARLSLVDLEDVAQAAATVLVEEGHEGAVYELAGPEAISHEEMAQCLSDVLGRRVKAQYLALEDWQQQAASAGLGEYALDTLGKMFTYYDRYGLVGSPRVLQWLLKRPPVCFESFAACHFGGGEAV